MGLLLLLFGLVFTTPPAWGHPDDPGRYPELHREVDHLLDAEGLAGDNVALMLFSRDKRRYLYRRNADKPLIAASNAKLATTYAALRVLRPNFRWKTVFYQVTPPAGQKGSAPAGLLVKGGGDPTLSARAMDELAVELRARGLDRVAGPLFFDASIFDRVQHPAAWGNSLGTQSWFAPVSPFIVDKNAAEFFIATGNGNENGEIQVLPRAPADFLKVVSRLTQSPDARLRINVQQKWDASGGTFFFNGQVPPGAGTHTFATAVADPISHFFHRLRASLHRAGIKGEMPLRPLPEEGATQVLLHAHYSTPLREIISEVNKESNNLTAEVVLRTMGLTRQPEAVSGQLGLEVMREALLREFPDLEEQTRFADGSGLSRDTRVSASFLVRLLNRVLAHYDFRSEYVASLALAGWDGTLQFRRYPERIWGRMRAKSGTLRGVQNLSGYLYSLTDAVVFSFLVNNDHRGMLALQAAQDRVMVGIFDFLLALETPPPPGEKRAEPPLPLPRRKSLEIPPPPKAASANGGEALPPPPVSHKPARRD